MTHSDALEAVNGGFFILSLAATYIFLHYIWMNRRIGYRCLRPAIAISVLFIGETCLRFYVWWLRDHINAGLPMVENTFLLALFSSIIAAGVLCIIRVFSPESWGNKPWVIALLAAIAFIIYSVTN